MIRKPSQFIKRPESFATAAGGVVNLVTELKSLKREVLDTVDTKIKETDSAISEIKKSVTEIRNLSQGSPGKDANEDRIMMKVLSQIRQSEKKQALNKESIIKEVLLRIPPQTLDEKKIIKKLFNKLPSNTPDLKIIQENIEVDPMSVIDKIMALPEDKRKKLKLKSDQIDGLEQTIGAFRNQLARSGGYLHGGGLSRVAHDDTLTGNGTPENPLGVVGGGTGNNLSPLTITGTQDGVNVTFTLSSTPAPADSLMFYKNGQFLTQNIDYTLSGTTITLGTAPDADDLLTAFAGVTVDPDTLTPTTGQYKTFITIGNTTDADYPTDGAGDNVEMQLAVDAVSASSSLKEIILLTNLSFSGVVTVKSNVIIDLNGRTITLANSANSKVFTTAVGGTSNLTIRNGIIDGNGTNQASGDYVVDIGGNTGHLINILLDKLHVKNSRKHAVFMHGDDTGYYNKVIQNCIVENHGVSSIGYGIYIDFAPNTVIIGNTLFNSNGNDAIEAGNLGQIFVVNNYLEDGDINYPFADNSVISGNILRLGRIINDTNTADNVIISNNQLLNATPPSGYGAIRVHGSNSTITGNYVKTTVFDGIRVQNGDNHVITGNYVESTALNTNAVGIQAGSNASNVIINGNIINNFDKATRVQWDNVTITNNKAVSCTTGTELASSGSTGHIIQNVRIENNDWDDTTTPFTSNSQTNFILISSTDRGTCFGDTDVGNSILKTSQANSGHSEVPLVVENVGTGNSQEWKSNDVNQARMSKAGTLTLGLNGLLVLNGASTQVDVTSLSTGQNTIYEGLRRNTNNNTSVGAMNIESVSTVTDGGTYTKSGAVVTLSSTVTETSGTITDSMRVLLLKNTHADATGSLLFIDNDGTGNSIDIDSNNATAINIDTINTNKRSIAVNNTGAQTSQDALIRFKQSSASTTVPVMELETDATAGGVLLLDNNGNGVSLNIDHDGNSASAIAGINIDVANAGAGAAYGLLVSAGRTGLNKTTPTARLHLGAGTATASTAPLKIDTGTALSVTEDGAMEYHASHLYFTIGSTRYQLDQQVSAGGAITRIISSISSPTTAGAVAFTDYVYYVSGTTTITLPTAVGNTNRYTIVHTDTSTMTIATTSSQTIAFYPTTPATTATITVQGTVVELLSDGSNWWTI